MESTSLSSVAPDLSLDSHCGSSLLLLPKELRLEIYRHVLVMPNASDYRDERANTNNPVLIMSRQHNIGGTSALRFGAKYVCNRDLKILQTSQQLREEAGDVFYRANVVTLYLYMTDEATLRSVMFNGGLNYVDLSRVPQCHILSAPGRFYGSNHDNKEEFLLCKYFGQFAQAMSRLPGHQMQDLLIECYHFEVARVARRKNIFAIAFMIEDLKMVRGIKHVHIRALNPKLWPCLRNLERLMTSNETSELEMEDIDTVSLGKVAIIETHESRGTAADEQFRRFGVPPLYQNTDFLHVL